jgi:hypothetical protein
MWLVGFGVGSRHGGKLFFPLQESLFNCVELC